MKTNNTGLVRFVCCVFAFMMFVRVASATSYYVSTGGDDSQNGLTQQTAFRTIGHGMQAVSPGDTLNVLPGTYKESVVIENMGSAAAAIVIRGLNGIPVLDGERTRDFGFLCTHCSNLVFEDFEIRNFTDIGMGALLSSDIVMRRLNVHENGFNVQHIDWELDGFGIHADDCQRVTIENNNVWRNGPQPKVPDRLLGTGIDTFKLTDSVIRGNLSHRNIGGGILVEDSVNIVVEQNIVYLNDLDALAEGWVDGGLWLDGGHDVTVRNNLFALNFGPGIEISDEDLQNPYGYVFENNRIVWNLVGVFIWNFGTSTLPPPNVLQGTGNQVSNNVYIDLVIVPWILP